VINTTPNIIKCESPFEIIDVVKMKFEKVVLDLFFFHYS